MAKDKDWSGPALPQSLLERLGLETSKRSVNGKLRPRVVRNSRKEQRKLDRVAKRSQPFRLPSRVGENNPRQSLVDSRPIKSRNVPTQQAAPKEPPIKRRRTTNAIYERGTHSNVLTTTARHSDPDDARDPGPTANKIKFPAVSKRIQRQLEADDAEISALERKLGLSRSKALPRSFHDDGLDELVDGLDDFDTSSNDDVEKWLSEKRGRRADTHSVLGTRAGAQAIETPIQHSTIGKQTSENHSDDSSGSDSEELASSTSQTSRSSPDRFKPPAKAYENPYVPPTSEVAQAKYRPPSLRDAPNEDSSEIKLLKRRLQGLFNKLSDSNVVSIVSELESVYSKNPRQTVTTALIDLLMTLLKDTMTLSPTFIILHAAFLAAIYRVVGVEFGAQLLQRLIQESSWNLAIVDETEKRKLSNIVALVSELYNFGFVGSRLLYDIILLFINDLSETSVDLLLRILRASGRDLRQDDPAALTDVVKLMYNKVASLEIDALSVRTRFMFEMIEDLKDGKVKTGIQTTNISRELTFRLRKTISVLNTRTNITSERLNVGLDDLRNIDTRGKWWLIGASYRDATQPEQDKTRRRRKTDDSVKFEELETETTQEADLIGLAQALRMNNDIRRAIFMAVMNAPDHQQAYHRLQKLRLKKTQELEIPRVIVRCCVSEASYNPYYALIARQLCSDHRLKMAFQFVLWDFFQRMEGGQMETKHDEEPVSLPECVNLAKLYGNLVAEKTLGLNILKNLNLFYLHDMTKLFVELLIVSIFRILKAKSRSQHSDFSVDFLCRPMSEFPALLSGLIHFAKTVVMRTDIANENEDRSTIVRCCDEMISISEDMLADGGVQTL